MAKRNHTRDNDAFSRITKQERFFTVGLYQEQPRTSWLRLCGVWLLQAGFPPATRVRVRVMRGCLVITTEPNSVQIPKEVLSEQLTPFLNDLINKGELLREIL